ncbi:MAG: cyclic pyranopterin monophosphate synthase MoaC [Eubacteriales bacterium]|nr:cyclic pyranopterin monophosphate synthase MoaC [Eubacteriales bacterium]
MDFTHLDEKGNAIMVDVSGKEPTHRRAVAIGRISMSERCFSAVKEGGVQKGDVLSVARVAGIMATKRTAELIPLCHVLNLTKCAVEFAFDEGTREIEAQCTVCCDGKTGVEMEALTGATIALLTIYDMCKALDKRMIISQVHLLEKQGGKSGDFTFGG